MKTTTVQARRAIYVKMLNYFENDYFMGGFCHALYEATNGINNHLNKLPELMKYYPGKSNSSGYWFRQDAVQKRIHILKEIIKSIDNENNNGI